MASVSAQGYPVEHIVCDGSSSDGTLAIINSCAPNSKVSSMNDAGIYDAMNRGIGLATGDVIGILNSDDVYAATDVIARVVALFAEHPEADIVYGGIEYVSKTDTSRVTRRWLPGLGSDLAWRRGWMPPHPALFVRAKVYRDLGCYDTRLTLSSDYEFMLRAMHISKLRSVYLPDVLVMMRTGGASTQSVASRLIANKEDERAWALNELAAPPALRLTKPLRKLHQWRWF